MSFFEPEFWIPSGVEFGKTFLGTGLNLYDSLVSTLICTLFSGIHICMTKRIMQLRERLAEEKGRTKKQHLQTLLLTGGSILFAGLFITSAFLYCIQFSRNLLVLRTTTSLSPRELEPSWTECLEGQTNRCIMVPLQNLYAGRRMELAFASLVQLLIFSTDLLLVVRCYFVFADIPYVWGSAALALVASFGISIFGLASLGKAGALSGGSSWNRTVSNLNLPQGYSPSMSIISSLMVNIIVTVSIVTRMLLARRRVRRNNIATQSQAGRRDDVYFTATALLIESALPPAVFGIFASIFASPSVQNSRKAFAFELIPKVAWYAFTALAPQLLLVRILQGRAWRSAQTSSAMVSSRFSRSTTVTAPISFSTRESDTDKGLKFATSESFRSDEGFGKERG